MWHSPSHMLMGKTKAAASKRTPPHLVPHLQKQVTAMKGMKGNSPTTGQPAFKRPGNVTGADGSTKQAQSQIAAAPAPFMNPRNAAQAALTVAKNEPATLGVGTGATPNTANISGSRAPMHPPTGPTGGYKPKKNKPPSGLSRFYGSR